MTYKERIMIAASIIMAVLSIFQAFAIAQPAMGQCIEPAQQQERTSTAAIETIIVDNSYHHL